MNNRNMIIGAVVAVVAIVGVLWQTGVVRGDALTPVEIARRALESEQQTLVEMKNDRHAKMDQLFQKFDGAPPAEEASEAPKLEPATETEQLQEDLEEMAAAVGDAVGGVMDEAARARLESLCLAKGNGDRPMILMPSFREFFSDESVNATCIEIATLDRGLETQAARITAAQKKVAEEEAKALAP